jgi:hypothetical protein
MAAAIDRNEMETRRALDILADHADPTADDAKRAFGRTICKAYSLASSVMRASPDRTAPADEMWMTVGGGDRFVPGPHTPMAGFLIDWDGLAVTGLGIHRTDTASPAELAAMGHYVDAFQAYERPRQPDGAHFRRKPTDAEMARIRRVALVSLDRAVTAATDAGLADPGFRYVRARLRHETALAPGEAERDRLLDAAAEDWQMLREMAADPAGPVTTWERARILLLSAATEAARRGPDDPAVEELQGRGSEALETVARDLFGDGRVHQDIRTWRKVAAAILADGGEADLPGIDFVTVE